MSQEYSYPTSSEASEQANQSNFRFSPQSTFTSNPDSNSNSTHSTNTSPQSHSQHSQSLAQLASAVISAQASQATPSEHSTSSFHPSTSASGTSLSRPQTAQTSALTSPTQSIQASHSEELSLAQARSRAGSTNVPVQSDNQEPSSLVKVQLMDGEMLIPKNLLHFRSFIHLIQAPSPETPIFLNLLSSEMRLFLHWSRYQKLPIMSVSETESLLCLAKEKGIDDLAGQLVRSRDHRALTGEEREILDQELMRNMENSLAGVILWPEPSRPGHGDGVHAAKLSTVTYRAFTHTLDTSIWDLPIGQKRMIALTFRFPLSFARPFAVSVEANDRRREEMGQPGWDASNSPAGGRCAIWNTYRADPGRQIWHRVFFDTIAKRIYRDGFEIEREFFDVVNSKTYYHLSH